MDERARYLPGMSPEVQSMIPLLAVKIDAYCRNNGSPTQVRINARDNWWCPEGPEGEPEEQPEGEPEECPEDRPEGEPEEPEPEPEHPEPQQPEPLVKSTSTLLSFNLLVEDRMLVQSSSYEFKRASKVVYALSPILPCRVFAISFASSILVL